jgi:dihydropyrimidine dehydrogenase (NAD+) subunit PreA
MADLTTTFLGIKSPNPFWLASAPPTDKAYNVNRAFEAGWGGAVWKTLGEDPPIVNVNGPRYGAIHGNDRRVLGFNNIELITDRPLAVNLQEIASSARQTRATSASAATTMTIRHHTSGSAGKLISLPRIAVNPHSSTQK